MAVSQKLRLYNFSEDNVGITYQLYCMTEYCYDNIIFFEIIYTSGDICYRSNAVRMDVSLIAISPKMFGGTI